MMSVSHSTPPPPQVMGARLCIASITLKNRACVGLRSSSPTHGDTLFSFAFIDAF